MSDPLKDWRNSSGQLSPDLTAQPINNAGAKWGVPSAILSGVFGMETNFGANVKTSSGGAVGLTQFLPATARAYGYPLTNTPNVAQVSQQFDATAHYLSDIFNNRIPGQLGNHDWNTTLGFYSGHGYGLTQVQAKIGQTVQANEAQAAGVNVPNPLAPISDVGNALASIWASLTTPALWKRVLYFIGGAVLLFWGIKELTGAHIPESVKTAAKAAV